jgi:hypothetical protein
MRKPCSVIFLAISFFGGIALYAQTHVSVPINHLVYYLLDQAEARGLCSPLPAVRPLSRGRIAEAINEILAAESRRFGGLSDAERKMLETLREEFKKEEAGLDLWRGVYRFDLQGKNGTRLSGNFGVSMESLNSAAYYREDKKTYLGTDTWGTFFVKGDVGENFSFNMDLSGGLMKAQRVVLGTYDTYAPELDHTPDPKYPFSEYKNQRMDTYSEPLAFFPYTYQKKWDGYMFGSGPVSASGMEYWPDGLSMAPSMLAEMSGSVFGDMLMLRAGRFQREWGAMTPGSGLVYNASARPFVAVEAIFNPVPWFSFSSLTGILEFYNGNGGIYEAAKVSQNAFSLQQIEFNYGNYFHIGFGSTAIWPKRFELGYAFPLLDNFIYQNFTGKTDNVAIHGGIKLRYPGLGGIWLSGFVDEMELSSVKEAFNLDRHMFAYQAGIQGVIPGVPFASFLLSYNKIEPYTYTHHKNYVPWYDSNNGPMEKAYVNNGVNLGYYLPPNSDEIKFCLDIRPSLRIAGRWQYQLIRHGADYGSQQVDGSSLLSELDPDGRSEKPSLRKSFLKDGAYQWMHIIKIGGEYKFASLPLTIFGEAGVAYSYFTTVGEDEYAAYAPNREPAVDGRAVEGDYPVYTAYIITLGFRVFK